MGAWSINEQGSRSCLVVSCQARLCGLRDLTATADGRVLAEAFPRISDPAVRQAVTRVVEALASA